MIIFGIIVQGADPNDLSVPDVHGAGGGPEDAAAEAQGLVNGFILCLGNLINRMDFLLKGLTYLIHAYKSYPAA